MRVVPPRNKTTTFNERRRQFRHKVPSIIYVGLGAGNGGIIIDLGAGGLSLQAVAELNPETELTLHFQLEATDHAIETRDTGCVTHIAGTLCYLCVRSGPGWLAGPLGFEPRTNGL